MIAPFDLKLKMLIFKHKNDPIISKIIGHLLLCNKHRNNYLICKNMENYIKVSSVFE